MSGPSIRPGKFTPEPDAVELSPDQRSQQAAAILTDLAEAATPASLRKAEVYRLLQFSRASVAFRFLACRILTVVRRCPEGHFQQSEPWQYCRERFLCPECATHAAAKQVATWSHMLIAALSSGRSELGPAVELEWALASPEDPKSIDRFNYHAEDVWQPRLAQLGIAAEDWMMPVAFDPAQAQVRGLYLGPPTPPGSLGVVFSESPAGVTPATVSVGSWRSGRWSGQTPAATPTWVPVEVDSLPPWHVGFDYLLQAGLLWVVGGSEDQARRLEPDAARAVRLDSRYHGRQLYSTRGRLHRARRQVKPALDPATGDSIIAPEAELVLRSWRREGESTTDTASEGDTMTITGTALKQLVQEVRKAVRDTFEEYEPKVTCPHCQAQLQVTFDRKLPKSLTSRVQ